MSKLRTQLRTNYAVMPSTSLTKKEQSLRGHQEDPYLGQQNFGQQFSVNSMWKEQRQKDTQQEQPLDVANSINSYHNQREEVMERVRMKAESE